MIQLNIDNAAELTGTLVELKRLGYTWASRRDILDKGVLPPPPPMQLVLRGKTVTHGPGHGKYEKATIILDVSSITDFDKALNPYTGVAGVIVNSDRVFLSSGLTSEYLPTWTAKDLIHRMRAAAAARQPGYGEIIILFDTGEVMRRWIAGKQGVQIGCAPFTWGELAEIEAAL